MARREVRRRRAGHAGLESRFGPRSREERFAPEPVGAGGILASESVHDRVQGLVRLQTEQIGADLPEKTLQCRVRRPAAEPRRDKEETAARERTRLQQWVV